MAGVFRGPRKFFFVYFSDFQTLWHGFCLYISELKFLCIMRKQFDIELGGSKMTAEIAKHLMLDVMLGGIKHRANTKTIVYGVGTYSNVVADMKAFKKWCKSQGLKVTSMYRNRQIETLDKEFTASVITYTF